MRYNQQFPFIFYKINDFEHTRFMLTYQRKRKARGVYKLQMTQAEKGRRKKRCL